MLKILKQCGLVLLGAVKINQLELNGKRIKFLEIHITYDVKPLAKKNFKQGQKKMRDTINHWKVRGRSIHGKVTIVKAFFFQK